MHLVEEKIDRCYSALAHFRLHARSEQSLIVFVHPLLSVTVTVYVPAVKPDVVAVVLVLLHR